MNSNSTNTEGQDPGGADDPLKTLRSAAAVLHVMALLVLLLGLIGGIIVAVREKQTDSVFGSESTRPYIGLGLGMVFAAMFVASITWLLSAWASAWADTKATS